MYVSAHAGENSLKLLQPYFKLSIGTDLESLYSFSLFLSLPENPKERMAPSVDSRPHFSFARRIGMLRIRCPVAWKTALAIAGAIAMIGVSPAPDEASSARSMK
jgi:hypothetical protein